MYMLFYPDNLCRREEIQLLFLTVCPVSLMRRSIERLTLELSPLPYPRFQWRIRASEINFWHHSFRYTVVRRFAVLHTGFHFWHQFERIGLIKPFPEQRWIDQGWYMKEIPCRLVKRELTKSFRLIFPLHSIIQTWRYATSKCMH